jgi:hypothetical protein
MYNLSETYMCSTPAQEADLLDLFEKFGAELHAPETFLSS